MKHPLLLPAPEYGKEESGGDDGEEEEPRRIGSDIYWPPEKNWAAELQTFPLPGPNSVKLFRKSFATTLPFLRMTGCPQT